MLPERQVKVNQLLKDTSSDQEKYCICQSTDSTRFMIGCDKCNEWYHGDCINVTKRDAKDIKRFYCHLCREKNPSLEIRYKKRKFTSDSSDADKQYSKASQAKKSSRRCGQCTNCHRTEDCKRCDFCKDMKKFGGTNKIRQKCRLRQCLNFGITGFMSAKESDKESAYTEPEKSPKIKKHKARSPSRKTKIKKKHRISSSSEHDAPLPKPEPKKHRGRKRKIHKHKREEKKRKISSSQKKEKRPRWRRSKEEENASSELEMDTTRQCYGPGCVEAMRVGSKYCSDECGIKLAKNRLCELLPPKIQQWQSSPCVAEENNKRQLEKIRRLQSEARQRLQELDSRHVELDGVIEKGRGCTVDPDMEMPETEDEGEWSIYCVTCGCEISQKSALRHMEKCFNKYEIQTSFGSIYKTRIEGNSMFCDFFNPTNKTYCKRLKALCPEHSKEPKMRPDEVCGCPVISDMFTVTGEICRLPKRKCNRHYCWEKLRRAEIDLQRVTQWLKLDELFEQERNTRVAMSNRMGVLGLMLHQTIDHDPLKPICPKLPVAVQ